MRGWLVTGALFGVALASVGAAIAASESEAIPQATCSLPGTVPCLTDPQCTPYGALCDVQSGACVCVADLGTVVGGADLGNRDGGGGSGGGGSGNASGVPGSGGGMTGPPKTGGCSFAPGSAPARTR